MAEIGGQVEYQCVIIDDDAARLAGVVNGLCEAGVKLLAFSPVPRGGGSMQLSLASDDPGKLRRALEGMGLSVSTRKDPVLDVVDEASEESFPASDAPSWTFPGRTG